MKKAMVDDKVSESNAMVFEEIRNAVVSVLDLGRKVHKTNAPLMRLLDGFKARILDYRDSQDDIMVKMSAHNFKRLEKVAEILGQTPEELLNGEVIGLALVDPEGCMDGEAMVKEFDAMTTEERRRYDALHALNADGWEPQAVAS